jgi:hypothetical protein
MKLAKRLLMVSGAVMLAGIVGVILNPKAAHAVFTLVQVGNDNAHPVPTLAAEALNSFDANSGCLFVSSANDNIPSDFCFFFNPIYTVPTGKIAVVERVSGRCITDVGIGIRETRLRIGDVQFSFLQPGPQMAFSTNNEIVTFADNIKTYAAAGAAVNIDVFATKTAATSNIADGCLVDISGYLVAQ